jgi:hypothetical protein
MRVRLFACAALTVALALGGCRTMPPAPADARSLVRTELYFGFGRKGGPDVSEQEWRDFVDHEITPRFPNGLTILDARGQWRGEDGSIVNEPSRVLILLHDPAAEDEAKIEQIRRAYRNRFAQEAVMRIDTMQRVSF